MLSEIFGCYIPLCETVVASPFVPVNETVIAGMTIQEALAALQGQITAVIGTSVIKGSYTPTITINGGASSITPLSASADYSGTGDEVGANNQIIVVCNFEVNVDASGALIDLTISNPTGTPATAKVFGQPRILPTANLATTGNIAAGTVNSIAPSGNNVRLVIESAQASTAYTVTVAWIYRIA